VEMVVGRSSGDCSGRLLASHGAVAAEIGARPPRSRWDAARLRLLGDIAVAGPDNPMRWVAQDLNASAGVVGQPPAWNVMACARAHMRLIAEACPEHKLGEYLDPVALELRRDGKPKSSRGWRVAVEAALFDADGWLTHALRLRRDKSCCGAGVTPAARPVVGGAASGLQAAGAAAAAPPTVVATYATLKWLADTVGAGDESFARRGIQLYLRCLRMSATECARRDLRLACRLFLPAAVAVGGDASGASSQGVFVGVPPAVDASQPRPAIRSQGPGFLWGPKACPSCPGAPTLDTWHRVTTCVETAPAREAACAQLVRVLTPPEDSAATDGAPRAPRKAAHAWYHGDEALLEAAQEVCEQRDTPRGRVFVFLATLGTTLPGGKAGRTGLPAEWCRLLNVPENRLATPWAWYKECLAMEVTVPAFGAVARAATQPIVGVPPAASGQVNH
jgi:hypothetical protein